MKMSNKLYNNGRNTLMQYLMTISYQFRRIVIFFYYCAYKYSYLVTHLQ